MIECPEKGKILYAPKASIMIVDDNSMNIKVIVKLLKGTGIQIEEADSGSACLEKLDSKHFDMIFMDHMMPMMDGIEALHRIRETDTCNRDVVVIALTANTDSDAGAMYMKEGFADFLLKPVKPDMLRELIIRYLSPELLENPEDMDSSDIVQNAEVKEASVEQKELPFIEGLDWEVAKSHFNDSETMWETLHNFYRILTKEAGQLNMLYNSVCSGEEITRYRICVHSMKSVSRLVGFTALSDMAKELEDAAGRNDLGYLFEKHCGFVDEWMTKHELLSAFFENDNSVKVIDRNAFIGHLDNLAAASEMLDVDIMDSVAKALSDFSLDWEGGQDKLDTLLAAVVDLDTDTIVRLVDELKEEAAAKI